MKYSTVWICVLLLTIAGCKKKNEKIEFRLTSLTLKAYKMDGLPKQNLYLKVLQVQNTTQNALTTTNEYPSAYTLPVKFGLEHPIKMNFYKNSYAVALYGDSSGFIGANAINIKDYKILYPLEMETESNGLGIILNGTWK